MRVQAGTVIYMDRTSYTAVVLAADRSSGDPLAEAAGVPSKCLVPAGGKPMVLRVLDALEQYRIPFERHPLLGDSALSVNTIGGGEAMK